MRLEDYDILLAEHTANDRVAINNQWQDYYPDPGKPLEELFRLMLKKNTNLVIIIPEIMTQLIKNKQKDFVMPVCHEYDESFAINYQLAKHYEIGAVIQMKHVPCSLGFESLDRKTQKVIAEQYQAKKKNLLDGHPTALVHRMIAEFLLHYLQTSLQNFRQIEESSKDELKLPFYKTVVDNSRDFDCRIEVLDGNQRKDEIFNALVDKNKAQWIRALKLNRGNFQFNDGFKQTTKCGDRGYAIDLHIGCKDCQYLNIKLTANFNFIDKTSGDEWNSGPLDCHISYSSVEFNPVLILPCHWENVHQNQTVPDGVSLCGKTSKAIKSLDLEVATKDNRKSIVLYSLIVEYKCCS